MDNKKHTDFLSIGTPAYILEEAKLLQNLEKIKYVQEQANVKVILALKAFALWKTFPLISKYLAGATASSLNEAQLITNHFKINKETLIKAHTYSPAYVPAEMEDLISKSSHITFNSLNQFQTYIDQCKGKVSCGLRVNPEWSSVETDLYNPSAKGSRLGEPIENLKEQLPSQIDGLHIHVLCESTSYDLEKLLAVFESKFSRYFHQLSWINLGGGHLMTQEDYDIEHLIKILKIFQSKYPHLEIILEPGSAVLWNVGVLTSTILDIVENNNIKTAILDVSFTCHMPDTLEMPYRPNIVNASKEKIEQCIPYRLGGVSCLAGDYLEAYYFEKELNIGDTIIFKDMIHYTTVKTTMFNGVQHPSIYYYTSHKKLTKLRSFDFEDYEKRMC